MFTKVFLKKAQGTRHKAQGTRNKGQGYKVQGTRHKVQDALCIDYKIRTVEFRVIQFHISRFTFPVYLPSFRRNEL